MLLTQTICPLLTKLANICVSTTPTCLKWSFLVIHFMVLIYTQTLDLMLSLFHVVPY